MPNRFCAICGKLIDDSAPHFGMCQECYLKEHPLFEIPNQFTFKVCIDCGNYSKKEEWIKPIENDIYSIIDEVIFKYILKSYLKSGNIEFNLLINEDSLEYSSKDLLKLLDLQVIGTLKQNRNVTYQQTIRINLINELCKNCTNLRGGTYFLAIIQLRVKDESHFEFLNDVINELHEFVEKSFQKDEKNYISKMEDEKNGVDLYLSSNEMMNHIISYLRGKYHFLLKRSKRLIGRDIQRGRNLYRLKNLVKFLPIEKRDVIKINDEEYQVENITKNRVILKNETGSKLIKDYSYFFNENISIEKK